MTNPAEPAERTEDPLRDLAQFVVDPASVGLLGERFCRRKRVVVLGDALAEPDAAVTIGMVTPSDTALVETVRQFLNRTVVPVRLTDHDVDAALNRGHDSGAEAETSIELGGEALETPRHPMHQVLVATLQQALALRASTIHIDVSPARVAVRARVDGVLRPLPTALDTSNGGAFLARVGALAGLPDASDDGPRRARMSAVLRDGDAQTSLQLELVSLVHGDAQSVVFRLRTEPPQAPRSFEDLGALPSTAQRLRVALASDGRAILLSGAPRSGRTQTLASCLGLRASAERKTVVLSAAEQLDVEHTEIVTPPSEADAVDWITALGDHDVDTLAIDRRASQLAEDHLALHPAGAALRLVVAEAMGPASALTTAIARGNDPMLLADQVCGVLHQRLLRRRCKACRDAAAATNCLVCAGSGWCGMIGVFEFLELVPSVARQLAQGASASQIRDTAIGDGQMTTAFDNAMAHVSAGVTTPEELARVLPPRVRSQPSAS